MDLACAPIELSLGAVHPHLPRDPPPSSSTSTAIIQSSLGGPVAVAHLLAFQVLDDVEQQEAAGRQRGGATGKRSPERVAIGIRKRLAMAVMAAQAEGRPRGVIDGERRALTCSRARAIISADRSTPRTSKPCSSSSRASTPLPHPRSMTRPRSMPAA